MSLHWDVWDPEMSGDIGSLPCGPMAEEIMAVVKEAVSNVLQHTDALNSGSRWLPTNSGKVRQMFQMPPLCMLA
jgi:hypothetical protein